MTVKRATKRKDFNASSFFNSVRISLFGRLSQDQVNTMNGFIDEAYRRKTPYDHLSYMLATTFHETAATMMPIAERGGNAYFTRLYDIQGSRPALARQYGNTTPGDGIRYRGRGFVQLTWKVNYQKASKKLGVDFVNNPELVMKPEHATRIMFDGMTEGWFTGRSLSSYLNSIKESDAVDAREYVNARRIINGTDQATKIAGQAAAFERALLGAGYPVSWSGK